MTHASNSDDRSGRRLWWMLWAIGLAMWNGCYDGESLLEQAHSAALSTSFAEVDLGQYQTTLPRDVDTRHFTTIDMHIFGTVSRSRLSDIKAQLAADEYRVRHETLAALRKTTREELADPKLTRLRERIEKAVNQVFKDSPLRNVGFHQLTVR